MKTSICSIVVLLLVSYPQSLRAIESFGHYRRRSP